MSNSLLPKISTSALLLAAFALVSVVVLAVVNNQTKDQIAENERQALLMQLGEVISNDHYDNALENSVIELPIEIFDTKKPVPVYLATKQGEPSAAIFLVTTMKGYAGAIKLLVGVNKDQTISGVRIVAHKETPGLGDKLELAKSNWILDFDAQSLNGTTRWNVKKDGGDFDQFTGATITPRAVVGAVHEVLQWSKTNFDDLFAGKYPALERQKK